jgi:hypothetical protein
MRAMTTGLINMDSALMIVASVLLVAVNWLAFHDFREAHTVRDWIMLGASALVLFEFARQIWSRSPLRS